MLRTTDMTKRNTPSRKRTPRTGMMRFAKNLAELMEMKRQYQAKAIMDAFIKSGKSYEEIMNFLNVDGD
jgi:hypothetical protein